MKRHDTIQELAERAMQTAVDSAKRYLSFYKVLDVDAGKLAEAIARHLKGALPEAIDDAREAFDCGMTEVAMTTFLASVSLAGIAAAKEVA